MEQEHDMDLITTALTVAYQVTTKKGETVSIDNPSELPSPNIIESMQKPIAEAQKYTPQEYVGPIMTLCIDKRGVQKNMSYAGNQVHLTFHIPMNEIVLDFFDRLKSCSKGYASLDYSFSHYEQSPLAKLDFMVNGERIDALSTIVHKERSYYLGRALTKKLKELIPRQMFQIAIQAAIGQNIVARETLSAMRKNVTAKCYGGDISRKKKLIEKQKAGKKRMKQIGQVNIPQEAFLAILKIDQ